MFQTTSRRNWPTMPRFAFVGTRSRPGADATVAFERWAVAEKIIDNAADRLAGDLDSERAAGR